MSRHPPDGTSPWSFARPLHLGLAALAALFLGFGSWSALAPIAGAIVASGRVEVEESRQVVQHPDGGVVAAIHTREGALVRAGDVLLSLDGVQLRSELAIVEGRLFELRVRAARLTAARDGANTPDFPDALRKATPPGMEDQIARETRLFHTGRDRTLREVEQLSRQIDQIAGRLDGIEAQRRAVARQLELVDEERASQDALLARGLARQPDVLALERERARLEGAAGELAAESAQAAERMIETRLQIEAARAQRREAAERELRDLGPEEHELDERRRILGEKIARLDLRAPVSGIVLGLAVTTPRAVIRAGDAVLHIVPQDRPMRIGAQISPADVDQVLAGQAVEVLASGFPRREAPFLRGRVALVSADAFVDPATHAGYFQIEVALDPGEAARLGERALTPGMPVEVFIRTGSHTPLVWLLKPFTDYFRHALRES